MVQTLEAQLRQLFCIAGLAGEDNDDGSGV